MCIDTLHAQSGVLGTLDEDSTDTSTDKHCVKVDTLFHTDKHTEQEKEGHLKDYQIHTKKTHER